VRIVGLNKMKKTSVRKMKESVRRRSTLFPFSEKMFSKIGCLSEFNSNISLEGTWRKISCCESINGFNISILKNGKLI
jgi:hypothetical protein